MLSLLSIIAYLTLFSDTNSHTIPIARKLRDPSLKATSCTLTGSNSQTTLGFGNCFNNLYYINLEVGTPSQTLAVHFDTGSNTLWVPTQQVTGVTPIFNTTRSSTFTNTSNPGSVQYADGSAVTGTYGTDVLKITNSPIDIVTTYLWATNLVNNNYPPQIQGLIGMGYTSIPNFLDVAFSNGEIGSPVFALQILDDTQQSLIHYDTIPSSITSNSFYEPVASSFYWGVSVTGVMIGGVDMTAVSSSLAIIDSGTSYFYLNSQLFEHIKSTFFSDCITNVQNVPVCSCNSAANWPTFAFNFTNVEVYIEPEDYTFNGGNNLCTYLFGTISGFDQILLGDIFFRNYIVTFDKTTSQIGFAGQNITNVTGLTPTPTPIPTDTDNPNQVGNAFGSLIGWALLGATGIIILIGLLSCMCIESAKQQFFQTMGMGPQFQLSAAANTVTLERRLQ